MPEPNQNRQAEMWDRKEAGPLSSTPEEKTLEPPPEPRLKRVNRQQLLLRRVDVELQARGIKKDRVGVLPHVYQAAASDCQGCAFRAPCCPGAKQRTLVRRRERVRSNPTANAVG